MNAKEFVASLWTKYYPRYEAPIKALRVEMCKIELKGPRFEKLFSELAAVEIMGGEAFINCLLRYPEIEYHLRSKIARQGFDEIRHYELLRDFMKEQGSDVDPEAEKLYREYYGLQTDRGIMHAMVGNAPEKNADNLFREYERTTKNPRFKEIARDINLDEAFHMELLNDKLELYSQDEKNREQVEEIFEESWRLAFKNNIRLARDLDLDAAKIFLENGYSVPSDL